MKLPNPNAVLPFDHISKDKNGNEEYGFRTVDGLEEIVHLSSGQSNMTYHQPELVLNTAGCEHRFSIFDIGTREVECRNCHFITSFHPALNYTERDGKSYFTLNHVEYEIFS
jgi:hypothetical protein